MSGSSYFKDYTAHQNATILVSSTEELNAAVAELAGTTGGTVLLSGEAGPYRLDARNLGDSAESAVLITSQDSNNPAQLKQVYIDNSVYLSLTDVTIDSGDYGFERSGHLHDIYVKSGAHLQFVDLTMTSTAEAPLGFDDDTVKAEDAVYLRNASDVLFADSTISNYYHGISLAGVRDTIVTGNDISALQGDGIRGGGVNNVLVSDNHIHDFLGATNEYNHPDMIQFWTGFPEGMTNTDLTITGNLLNAGEGSAAQGILVQNEAFDDAGDPLEGVYGQNLTITDNVIHSGMSNGIGIIGYQGVEVANNSVLWNEGAVLSQTADAVPASNPPWILVRNSLEVETAGNVAHLVRIETEDQAETNYFLDYDNPSAPNYAYAHVIGLAADGQTDVYDLQFRPDSPLNGVSGAEASTWTPSEAPVNAVISQQPSLEDRAAVELSARYSTVDGQLVDPETAQVFWTLADGTVLEGLEVTVTFDTPGLHEVTLDVLAPDGSSDSATRSVDIRGNGLFEADFARSETFGDGVEIVDPNGEAFSKKGVFTLDGDSVFEVTRGNPEFETLHTLSMDVSFKPDAFEKNGWLVKWLKAVDLRVTDEKGLWLKIETDADVYEIRTEGNLLEKGEWADIAVDFDSHAGQMRLSLDGEELGRTDVEGTISGSQYDLTLGEGRGRSAEGEIDYFSMTTPPAGSVLEIGDRFPEEPEEPEDETPPPVGVDDSFITDEDVKLSGDVLDNDINGQGAILTVSLLSDVSNGILLLNNDGTFDYTAAPDFNGSDSFTYTVSDGSFTDTATVSITVNYVNDNPVLTADTVTTKEDISVNIDVVVNDTDVDGDTLSVSVVGAASNGTTSINLDGTVSYTPNLHFFGTDSFIYTAYDGHGGVRSSSVTVTVDAVNDAPVIEISNFAVDEEQTTVGKIIASDVEDHDLDFAISGGADADLFDITEDGELSFLVAPDFEAPLDVGGTSGDNIYEVEVSAFDTRGALSSALFNVAVKDVDEGVRPIEVLGTGDNDVLTGTVADERLISHGGRIDRMTGGGGADEFVFGPELDNNQRELDIIYDYDTDDTIILGSDDYRLISLGNSVLIHHNDDGDLIYVLGTEAESLMIEIENSAVL